VRGIARIPSSQASFKTLGLAPLWVRVLVTYSLEWNNSLAHRLFPWNSWGEFQKSQRAVVSEKNYGYYLVVGFARPRVKCLETERLDINIFFRRRWLTTFLHQRVRWAYVYLFKILKIMQHNPKTNFSCSVLSHSFSGLWAFLFLFFFQPKFWICDSH